jgi:tetrahydromethanopterin S-methyltransferase subunit G
MDTDDYLADFQLIHHPSSNLHPPVSILHSPSSNFHLEVLSRLDGLEKDVSVIKESLFQMRAEFREDLGQLRREMNQRLDEMNQRFDGVNQRFDGVNRGFDGMHQRFDEMNQRFESRLDQMSERMLVQTRWLIGSIALFGTILTIMMAIAQFTP